MPLPFLRVWARSSLVRRGSAVATFLFVLLGAISCFGQTPQSNAKVFTLEQAVNYALANYPAVRAAMSQVNAAKAGVGVARTAYLPQANSLWQVNRGTRNNIFGQLLPQSVIPSISGPVLPSTSGANVWGSAAGLLASWEPFDFGLRGASVNVARAGEATAQALAGITRLEVALATANAYLALLAARQITETTRADVERREVFASSVSVLVQNELRPGADASRAEADLAQARIRLIQAQTAEDSGRAALATLLGLGATEIEVAPGPLLKVPSPAALPAQESAKNPFALAQRARVEESQARDRVLSKSYFPEFTLQSAVSGRGSGAETNGQTLGGTAGLDLQRMNWAAGVQVTFPILQIFSVHAQQKVEQANEATERARYDQALQDVTGQVAQAQVGLEGARQIAQETPVEIAAARDSEQQARARYDAGLATLVEVSQAQSLLVQAEIDDAVARLSVWRSLAGLAGAQGDIEPFLSVLRTAGP
jgi:outer membrane protein